MTELQSSIRSLNEVISVGNILLTKLEKVQKDSETLPQHRWEHGDVFENNCGVRMVFIKLAEKRPQIYCLGSCTGHNVDETASYLTNAKILFNIKEKL